MFTKMEMVSAVRAGVQYALLQGYDADEIEAVVQDAAEFSGMTVNSGEACECWDTSGASPSWSEDLGSCSTNCTDTSHSRWKLVTVIATYEYSPEFFPTFFTDAFSLSESATVRIE